MLAGALASAAACGGESTGSPTAALTTTPGGTIESTTNPTPSPRFNGGTSSVEATPATSVSPAALLTDVRVAAQNGFDRLTFEFKNAIPGYRVQYVQPPIILDPSGKQVDVAGQAFITVRMEPAAGHDPNTGQPTYAGSQDLKPGLTSIVEARQTGDFEGVLAWVIGVGRRSDFRVLTLDNPPRLIVDVVQP